MISVLLLLVCLKDKVLHFLASSANLRRICIFACRFALFVNWQARQMWIQPCQNQLASCSDFQPFTNLASRASVYTLSQIQLAKSFPFSPFTIFASRASGYPLLQKPRFQIMTIYNSFIIFLIGFLPLVGEFLPQTPNKNRRENLKIFSPSCAINGLITIVLF